MGVEDDCGGDEVGDEVGGAGLLIPTVWDLSTAAGRRFDILGVVWIVLVD